MLQALTMSLLDRQSGATARPRGEANRPGISTGRVQLRLRADGQLFEVPPGKTMIGSSPRCNLRIQQPGVQPLHCLIVDGPEGLRVRSWVANTNLNGSPFEESALSVGDCLSLGPVEVEIIDPRVGLSQAAAVEVPVVESKEAEKIRAGRDRARSRSRQLLASLRRERTTHLELCQQVARLQESHFDAIAEQNEISSKLESSLAELAEARRQLGGYQSVEIARQELADRNEQLGFEIGELSAQIDELTQDQIEAAQDRQQLAEDRAALQEQHRQLIEANTRLQSEVGRRANEKSTTDEQNRQLAARNVQLQNEVGHLTNQNAVLEAERVGFRRQIDQLLGEASAFARDQELDDQSETIIEAYESLNKEHDQLHREADQLREQVQRLSEEQVAAEGAWQVLSAEAATLSDAQQRLADANAQLLVSLDEARQQRAQQDQEMQDSLARVHEESQRRLEEAESRQAELSRRILELESQLAGAEKRAAMSSAPAAIQFTAHSNNTVAERAQQLAEQAGSTSYTAKEQPTGSSWLAADIEHTPHDNSKLSGEGETFSRSSADVSASVEAAWDRASTAADEWNSVNAETSSNDSDAADWERPAASEERRADKWLNSESADSFTDTQRLWDEQRSQQARQIAARSATTKLQAHSMRTRVGIGRPSSRKSRLPSRLLPSPRYRSSERLSRRAKRPPSQKGRRSSSNTRTCLRKMTLPVQRSQFVRTKRLHRSHSRRASFDRKALNPLPTTLTTKTRLSNTWRSCCSVCAATHPALLPPRSSLREYR